VDLSLRTGTTCELLEAVLAQEVEGAFLCGPVAHPDLDVQVVFREELAVLTAPGVRSLPALLAQGEPRIVVLRLGCSYRQRLEEILARRGIPSLRRLEFGTLEAIIGCVAAGLGVTLLPKALIGPVWTAGRVRVHDLPPEEAAAETLFVRRRDAHLSSALAALLHMLPSPAEAAPARAAE
jgi:LysR family transcriptional regulator, cell division regulator